MPEIRQIEVRPYIDRYRRLAHGEQIKLHRHEDGQLIYPATGLLSVTTEQGTWLAPADRAVWTPTGFGHAHRAHGRPTSAGSRFPRRSRAPCPSAPRLWRCRRCCARR